MVKNLPTNAGDMSSIPGLGRSSGEGMAIHSSILAWRIPETAEPGGLQSVGSQRVGHDFATKQQQLCCLLSPAHSTPIISLVPMSSSTSTASTIV